MIKAVIMAGGSGTRLWPLSRSKYPKQFLNLCGDSSMLQSTVSRLDTLDINSSVVICNEEHRFLAAEQLREIDMMDSIILEPVGRNTAPAIALAAMSADDDPLLLVMAADHVIQNVNAFRDSVTKAIPMAEDGKLVTFGIVPKEPHTGYGYIEVGNKFNEGYLVNKFVEKPSLAIAKNYVESNNYLWNSGMFLFRASKYLEELANLCPDIHKACALSLENVETDLDFIRIDNEQFVKCPSKSIDYAVMEKTDHAVVVAMDAGWSDIGSWSSLWNISEKDSKGNVVLGDVMLHETNNSYVRSDGKLLAAVGVKDLAIISTKDAIMVSHKNCINEAKNIVDNLKSMGRTEWEFNRETYRPWGKYDSIDNGERYQVKRITVKPGAKLSVQMHHHRAEHWIVVSGSAKVTNGEKTFLLSENESTFIPVGVVHALENPGKVELQLIEVQSGAYLGEDDIVRFEDIYGRVPS